MSAVIIKQGGTAIQRKRDDREQFSAIMVQLRFLSSNANAEMAEHMMRHLNERVLHLSKICGINVRS